MKSFRNFFFCYFSCNLKRKASKTSTPIIKTANVNDFSTIHTATLDIACLMYTCMQHTWRRRRLKEKIGTSFITATSNCKMLQIRIEAMVYGGNKCVCEVEAEANDFKICGTINTFNHKHNANVTFWRWLTQLQLQLKIQTQIQIQIQITVAETASAIR